VSLVTIVIIEIITLPKVLAGVFFLHLMSTFFNASNNTFP
jgi:hypothetical protein